VTNIILGGTIIRFSTLSIEFPEPLD